MLRLALERHQTVPTRKITGRSRLQSGRCSRCANECRGWSEWRAGRPRCSLTSRDRRMRCCGARTSKRRRCGLVTHPYRLRQLSSPQYDRRNSSPPVETIRAGLTNVGHSLNRGGERPWQEIADLLEWLKRSPALPHPPSSDVGLKVDPNLAPGLQLPRSRKHCVRETPLSSISRSRSLARSADEAAESSSFAWLPCLSSSSRSDVRAFKFPSPLCVDGARRRTGNTRS